MNIAHLFLIYVTLFRLAIICAGVISMALGYRLFCKGVGPEEGGKGSSVDVWFIGTNVSLGNAAPGTCFALFGMIIICIMFATDRPELTWETISNARSGAGVSEEAGKLETDSVATRLKLRCEDGGTSRTLISDLNHKGVELQQSGETGGAIAVYKQAISMAGGPMNNLAWIYQEGGNYRDGLPLARVAVQVNPGNANFMETLAVILCKGDRMHEAMSWIQKAAALDKERFGQRLKRFEQGCCE